MTLVPSPIAKNALVNEGEGVRFVSHTGYDAGTRGMLRLRKYSGGFGYMAGDRASAPLPAAPLLVGLPVGTLALWKDLSDAPDLRAQPLQLFLNVLVATIDVVDAIDDGLPVSDQGGEHQRSRRPEIRG